MKLTHGSLEIKFFLNSVYLRFGDSLYEDFVHLFPQADPEKLLTLIGLPSTIVNDDYSLIFNRDCWDLLIPPHDDRNPV